MTIIRCYISVNQTKRKAQLAQEEQEVQAEREIRARDLKILEEKKKRVDELVAAEKERKDLEKREQEQQKQRQKEKEEKVNQIQMLQQ